MAESNQTEKATPQRRKKAREQGQVARSKEFGSVLAIVGTYLAVSAMARGMALHWITFYSGLLSAAAAGDVSADGPIVFWTALEVLRWIAPVLLLAMLLSVGVTLAQGGINFAPAALSFKPERLSPASRLSQVFSMSTLGSLLKSLLPFSAIALIGASAVQAHWTELVRASGENTGTLILTIGGVLQAVGWKSALVLLAWASVDYVLTWRQAESQLRMSREEITREHKETEGNPFTKGQVRKRQRAMRQRKPLEAAATATMIVTNPTHFAVALRYEAPMGAPEVVAKGRDLLAQKIKAIAQENSVPIMENKPVARALYKGVEVGQAIPAELYQAVAEILVVVFRAQAELRERERSRSRGESDGGSGSQR